MQLDAVDSPRAKLVLLYLHERGPAPAERIADELDMGLLSTLGVLDTMRRDAPVERRGARHALAED